MGKQPASNVRIYWDQYKISPWLNSASLAIEQEIINVDDFESVGPEVLVGNYRYTYDIGGFGDFADDQIDEITHADIASGDHYAAICPLNTSGIPTENTIAYEGIAALATRPITAASGAAWLLSFTATGTGGLTRATVLRSATVTGTGNGTGRNLGATTSGQRFMAVFRVISGTFSEITMNIQESSDDGSGDAYANISGLTSGSLAAANVVYASTTSATEAWKRVAVASFTGTNAVVLVTVGRVAGE